MVAAPGLAAEPMSATKPVKVWTPGEGLLGPSLLPNGHLPRSILTKRGGDLGKPALNLVDRKGDHPEHGRNAEVMPVARDKERDDLASRDQDKEPRVNLVTPAHVANVPARDRGR